MSSTAPPWKVTDSKTWMFHQLHIFCFTQLYLVVAIGILLVGSVCQESAFVCLVVWTRYLASCQSQMLRLNKQKTHTRTHTHTLAEMKIIGFCTHPVCFLCPPFNHLNQLPDFYKPLCHSHVTEGHTNAVLYHFQQSVVTTWRTHEFVRRDQR
jgi:hypothetical protein